MEKDIQLQELLKSTSRSAANDFTGTVMKKINGLAAKPAYVPLVNGKFKKLFLYIFGTIIVCILGICLIMGMNKTGTGWLIPGSEFVAHNYDKILIFIISFWSVFTVKTILEKRHLLKH
ncbi:MAG: hypothetical protein ABIY51_09095 [Ferruginibacter sp.]